MNEKLLCALVCLQKSKVTKILNSEENWKRKVPNQMAWSKDKTNQTNGQQLSYSWLGTGIFKCTKWWIEPGFVVLNLSLIWQLHQIPLQVSVSQLIFSLYLKSNYNSGGMKRCSMRLPFIMVSMSWMQAYIFRCNYYSKC